MNIRTEYICGGSEYVSTGLTAKHFEIACVEDGNRLMLKILPDRDIKFKKFEVTFDYEYDDNCRIFVNGYQSWTDSREYFKTERLNRIHPILGKAISKTPASNAGDYSFKKYPKKSGIFFGWSYGYVRLGDRVELFGSLTERLGYTSITFDTRASKVIIEKDLEGVTVNEGYKALELFRMSGGMDEVFDAYFEKMNIPAPTAEPMCGYTTWYNYYQNVNENIVYSDLDAILKTEAKIDIFQIDDGYQTAVGDWLSIDSKKFPGGMKKIADSIHEKGLKAGLWLAPLGCQIKSKLATEHPDWLIKHPNGKPVNCGLNWGGFYALDIANPEAADYIRNCFKVILEDWGYDMVKLDFLYAACIIPLHGKSRGQLMCEAMDFIRECVGDKLILGCGVPLAPAFGKVDFCRIGADMGLSWKETLFSKSTHREDVSTNHAINNSIFRRQLNARAFLNDPDVFILRDNNIHMDFERRSLIAKINKLFGSLLFISDNTDKYNEQQRKRFLETLNGADIKIIKAEYSLPKVLHIVYEEDGVQNSIKFDTTNGKMISGNI